MQHFMDKLQEQANSKEIVMEQLKIIIATILEETKFVVTNLSLVYYDPEQEHYFFCKRDRDVSLSSFYDGLFCFFVLATEPLYYENKKGNHIPFTLDILEKSLTLITNAE